MHMVAPPKSDYFFSMTFPVDSLLQRVRLCVFYPNLAEKMATENGFLDLVEGLLWRHEISPFFSRFTRDFLNMRL